MYVRDENVDLCLVLEFGFELENRPRDPPCHPPFKETLVSLFGYTLFQYAGSSGLVC